MAQPWVTAGCHDLADCGSGVTLGQRFRDPRVWRERVKGLKNEPQMAKKEDQEIIWRQSSMVSPGNGRR
jgi:hypothetical protein